MHAEDQPLHGQASHRRTGAFFALTVLTVVVAASSTEAMAGTKKAEATKTITWQAGGVVDDLGQPVPSTGLGKIGGTQEALGTDRDLPGPKKTEPIVASDWKLKDGLNPTTVTTTAGDKAHALGEAKATFSAARPTKVAGKETITAQIKVSDTATVQDNTKVHGPGLASATTSASMTITGYSITKVQLSAGGQVVDVPLLFLGPEPSTIYLKADSLTGLISDPVSVGFLDLVTGAVVQEDLFDYFAYANGGAQLSWDQSGVVLRLSDGGTGAVGFDFQPLSTWITDASLAPSSISFTKGNFTATGIFAGLPWVVGATTVSLAGGFLDAFTVPYDIPDELLVDDHDYVPFLNISTGAHAEISVVPEPSAWALAILGFGLVGAAARRRRPRCATLP